MIGIKPQRPESPYIYNVQLISNEEIVGNIYVEQHPNDKYGAEVHLEIAPKWRGRWLSRSLRDQIFENVTSALRRRNICTLYSTALREVSPRLLEFFKFKEYCINKTPKTYYYLNIT